MGSLRIGLIGLGSMGRHHARVIRETDGMELVAVADPGGDRFGVAKGLPVLEDVQSLIAAELDAAVVATPTIEHEAVALELAHAGVHTLVEKPIAHDIAAGERVARAFRDAGCVGAVGYVERCNPAVVEVRRRIQAGQLGSIYQITTSRQGPFPARVSDVGVVKDLATHDVDLTAWLAGASYSHVSAYVTRRSGREHEDMLVTSGALSNGVIVNHLVNWLSPRKERQTVVIGEHGSLVADTLTGDVTFYENGTISSQWEAMANFRGVSEGNVVRYAFAKKEPLRVEQENFRDAIRGEKGVVVPMEVGVEILRVVEAILESAHTRRSIAL